MFKLFDRYILKEIFPPFFIGLLAYSFVLLMNQILLLSELFIARGVPFSTVLGLLVYLIPSVLAFTVPMSVLMGILAGLSRMSSDAEITAFKTLGISYKRILWPVLIFSFFGFIVTSVLALYLAPQANYRWVQTLSKSVMARVQFNIRPRQFDESIPNTTLFIQDIGPDGKWKNIFVYFSTPPEEPKFILAQEGKLNLFPEERRVALELHDGTIHSYLLNNIEDYRITSFGHYEEELDVEGVFQEIPSMKRVREKDIRELWKDIETIEQDLAEFSPEQENTLQASLVKRDYISHWIEIHKKFALPVACLVFALLGLPLGAHTRKGGRTSGFTLSIVIILLYYILITAGEQMAMEGRLSPFAGMWGPNIFFLLIGLFIFIQSVRESSFLWFFRLFKRRGDDFLPKEKKRAPSGLPRFVLPFPNIIDRYIIRKFLAIFAFVFVSLVSIYAIVNFFERINSVYEHNKPLTLLFSFIWHKIPESLQYIFPVTALTAALLSLGLLTKFNEITAMKACGISLYRIIVPVLVLAGVVSFCAFYLQENILPFSNKKAEQIWDEIIDKPPRRYGYLDLRWVLSRGKERVYHYRYFNPDTSTFRQISIFDIDPDDWSIRRRFFAERGYLEQGELRLSDVWVREYEGSRVVGFEKNETMTLAGVEDSDYFMKEREDPDQMSYKELHRYIEEIEERGFETVKFKVDLKFKISFPLASLIMALLGIPFAFKMGKRGTLVGLGLSMVVAMAYWGTIAIFKSLGYVSYLGPFLAAWGPNLLFGCVGLYLISTLET